MPLIQVSDIQHKWLKSYAAQNETTMTAVLRMALHIFMENPAPILHAINWFVTMYLWDDGRLERRSEIDEIETTGELPALAAAFVGAPGVAEMVRADLPRLRQVLARTQSTSARLYNADRTQMLQINVFRESPAQEAETTTLTRPLRV